jgi:hypothetical protein
MSEIQYVHISDRYQRDGLEISLADLREMHISPTVVREMQISLAELREMHICLTYVRDMQISLAREMDKLTFLHKLCSSNSKYSEGEYYLDFFKLLS